MSISAILLAGGKGHRMGSSTPKQYLHLQEQPVALFSFGCLSACAAISEVVVVCEPIYRTYFQNCQFAEPGPRRQDSLKNGFRKASAQSEFILIHDAARPFIDASLLDSLIEAGRLHGAAALAVPAKATIKRARADFVVETLNRSELYEIQTPQILRADLLSKGLIRAEALGVTVTDDVSLAELIGHPVKLIPGSEHNIKITTPFDLSIAETILSHDI